VIFGTGKMKISGGNDSKEGIV